MAKIAQDFDIWQSNTLRLKISVKNTDGAPYDLTGVQEITWIVQKLPSDVAPLLSKTKSNGDIGISSPATQGWFVVNLVPSDVGLGPGKYHHEAKLTDSQGSHVTVTVGTMTVHSSGIT